MKHLGLTFTMDVFQNMWFGKPTRLKRGRPQRNELMVKEEKLIVQKTKTQESGLDYESLY